MFTKIHAHRSSAPGIPNPDATALPRAANPAGIATALPPAIKVRIKAQSRQNPQQSSLIKPYQALSSLIKAYAKKMIAPAWPRHPNLPRANMAFDVGCWMSRQSRQLKARIKPQSRQKTQQSRLIKPYQGKRQKMKVSLPVFLLSPAPRSTGGPGVVSVVHELSRHRRCRLHRFACLRTVVARGAPGVGPG